MPRKKIQSRAVLVLKTTKNKNKMKKIMQWLMFALAIVIVLGFFATVYILFFVEISQMNKDLLNIVLGAEIASFVQVVQWFFGSSKGSSDKTDIMANGKSDVK